MSQFVICPTVTAFDPHEYRAQMERIQPFAKRIHIDLMDGEFAPTKSPSLEQVDQLIKLKPNLVVIHYEADVDHKDFAGRLHKNDIKTGLAILHDTSVEEAYDVLSYYDHALVFSGKLGYHGGEADLSNLDKVRKIRGKFPNIEISWDGGINDQNARQLIEGGVDVLNVGGFIQKSVEPLINYQQLEELLT